MSQRHQNRFDAISREHDQVFQLLSELARRGHKSKLAGLPQFDPLLIEAAVATVHEAYSLRLIAAAEGFLREYLDSQGIALGTDPKLDMLINRTYKVFNQSGPRVKLRVEDKVAFHDLREQRNRYAHGQGSVRFPKVGRIVAILGGFFKDIP